MPILDYRGNPANAQELKREHAHPLTSGIRSVWRTSSVKGLTPTKLARILRTVDTGNVADEYLILAEEMEEKDLHYASVLRTRKLAVSRLTPMVEAVSDEDQHVLEAEFAQRVVKPRSFKNLLFDAMDALGKGYSFNEIDWDLDATRVDLSGERVSAWIPRSYKWRDPRFFRYDLGDLETPRLLTVNNMDTGEDLPAYVFVYHVPKIKSGAPLRSGLARLAAFAFMCKSYSIKDWMAFAEVYGMPLRIGKYGAAASEADIATLKTAITQLGHDAGAVLPESMVIEFVDAARMASGSSSSDPVFGKLAKFLNSEVSKGVLGQTMTTDDGSSKSQAQVHDNVRDDYRDNDAEQLSATIQRDLINPLIDVNFGPREIDEYPLFSLMLDVPEDLKTTSDALTPLIKAGLRVEAQWVRDKFGADMPADDAEVIGEKSEEEKAEEAEAKAKADAALKAAAGEPAEPAEPDDKQEEAALQRALHLVLNALPASANEEIEALTEEEARNWRAQMDPMLTPIIKAINRSKTIEDVTRNLDDIEDEMDEEVFTDRLATSTYKARGLGDAKDSPAELASMKSRDAVALLVQSVAVQGVVFDKDRFPSDAASHWLHANQFADDLRETDETWQSRQREPDDFVDGSFKTITIATGIKAVIGRLK